MEPIEDINGFSNLVFIDGRSFDNLKERMITQVRVPARVIDIGLKPNGFPYAIIQVTAKEKPAKDKKVPPAVSDPSIVVEPGMQPS